MGRNEAFSPSSFKGKPLMSKSEAGVLAWCLPWDGCSFSSWEAAIGKEKLYSSWTVEISQAFIIKGGGRWAGFLHLVFVVVWFLFIYLFISQTTLPGHLFCCCLNRVMFAELGHFFLFAIDPDVEKTMFVKVGRSIQKCNTPLQKKK